MLFICMVYSRLAKVIVSLFIRFWCMKKGPIPALIYWFFTITHSSKESVPNYALFGSGYGIWLTLLKLPGCELRQTL